MRVRFTLIGDGPFDGALLPIVRGVLAQQRCVAQVSGEFADPHRLPKPSAGLPLRVARAVELYPCNMLFVHRDGESQGRAQRLTEIEMAVSDARRTRVCVPIIPIRMTEAWLLVSESAIRHAAGNPNGRMQLSVPSPANIERRTDPKQDLHRALRDASGLNARMLARFDVNRAAYRVAELLDDLSPLRALEAFRRFEDDLSAQLIQLRRLQG